MADLFKPLETTRKFNSGVGKFGTLSPNPDVRAPIQLIEASSTRRNEGPSHSRGPKRDSTAFVHQSYLLNDGSSQILPDEAREILKSQPDPDDFIAVLQYLQLGIEGKHDFNVRVSGPKESQLINVIVTVTVPDRWASLNTKPASKKEEEAKSMLVSCLTCTAGLGALHTQIKALAGRELSSKTGPSLMVTDAIDVLANVMGSSSLIETILGDVLKLHSQPAQRHVLWQELSSFVAGGRILSAVAQAFPLTKFPTDKPPEWLADGKQYSAWLARNICHAATKVAVADSEAWLMLAQLLKRGLSLGHSGKSRILLLGRSFATLTYPLMPHVFTIGSDSFDGRLTQSRRAGYGDLQRSSLGHKSVLDATSSACQKLTSTRSTVIFQQSSAERLHAPPQRK